MSEGGSEREIDEGDDQTPIFHDGDNTNIGLDVAFANLTIGSINVIIWIR
jgi:hypothetical protein